MPGTLLNGAQNGVHERTTTSATLVNDSPVEYESPTSSPTSSYFPKKNGVVVHEIEREDTLMNHLPSLDNSGIVPPEHLGRTLVLCFDGTGDQFDSDNSNIVEFFRLLKKDDRTKQMVYYQAGIGTYTTPEIATPMMAKLSKALDEAIAWNLDAHVMGGYEFLMQNYSEGDRICLFGFSRGAYTARSLAGMIHKVGILPACNHQQVPFAYKMFTKEDEEGWQQSNAFKKAFSIDADIEFVGVWDTVNSVGLIPKRLPFTTSNTIVRTFRHAVSLDERRSKFKANHWNRPQAHEENLGIECKHQHKPGEEHDHEHEHEHKPKKSKTLRALERKYGKDRSIHTDIDEVWFAGCHCDVGGGSVDNETKPNLARIPLRWMIRECFRANTGIMFHADLLQEIGMDPNALYPEVKARPPALPIVPGKHFIQHVPTKSILARFSQSQREIHLPNFSGSASTLERAETEEELELADALSPVYDQLSLKWFWWILEFWPIKMRFQKSDNTWAHYLGWNLGQGRHIPKQKKRGVRVHRSVKMRLDARYPDGSRYIPKANLDEQHVTWVE
ncbi:hypothetical protein Moror_883 [Moniliophthora roreri MCA 2997]|uniref:T6SS Phospholipase effector Tle1-like catalytic domain-containing protein n=2 Tax=Moniliophthora roreri TaxID=221103 RepID=V2XBG6_MONRO|nr:hypothetical protein Moror_883 [Moniliophthora roreri MCA 2997]KAI3606330.1 hypothetical protein WG66_009523 [Moniliophthora roreri]